MNIEKFDKGELHIKFHDGTVIKINSTKMITIFPTEKTKILTFKEHRDRFLSDDGKRDISAERIKKDEYFSVYLMRELDD